MRLEICVKVILMAVDSDDFMRTRKVLPLLLSMSLPMVLSMLVSSLYNIVDSYFVAMISEDAMTALSLVFPLQNLVSSIGVGFGIGVNASISYYRGAGASDKANAAATGGLILSVAHGLLLAVICIAISSSFLQAFTSSGAIVEAGVRYSVIVFAFAVINIIGITFEKIFQAVGRMKVSMTAMMAGCVANIMLDPVFIFGMGPVPAMGIEGAAFATGLGQLLSLMVYLIFYFRSPIGVTIRRDAVIDGLGMAGRLYGVGIPATLNLALSSVLVASLNAILSSFAEVYTLILGIYYRLQSFLYLPASGLVQGMRPIIGYNHGAGERERVRQVFLLVLLLCALLMLLGTILCLAVPERLISIFSDSAETIAAGADALRIISLGFIVSSVSVAASGALEGLGRGLPSLWISLLRYVVIIIPLAYVFSIVLGWGPDGVWTAFWVSEAVSAAFSIAICRRIFFRLS